MRSELERRARLHAALGDPLRLAIIDELGVSDRTPAELAERFGVRSNLLAHHLDVLDQAGLIDRLASSGDRRRRYVRLRRRPLEHLGLRPTGGPGRMLFVCSLNSARSQLAAALWTSRTGRPAASAGTRPARRVHPGAVAAARRIGLDISDATPRRLTDLDPDARTVAQVVTVCDQAHEELDAPTEAWHWSIPDPVERASDGAFDATVRELEERITDITRGEGNTRDG